MISKSLRAWNIQHHHFPSIFLYQNTPSGFFSITEVEAEISDDLSPIEKICLGLAKKLEAITRIELHAVSGMSLEICDEYLSELQHYGLLELIDYKQKYLDKNVKRIIREFGNDWLTPHVHRLTARKLLKQYKLTHEGQEAFDSGLKKIRDAVDLNTIITGKPFYLFYDRIDLRPTGYESITITPEMIEEILSIALKYEEHTGITPIAIGANSVTEGKEVANSQFWISIEGNSSDSLDDAKYNMYLSSRTFDRWANPRWNSYLKSLLPQVENITHLVIKSISETFMMVEDVIEEGISLSEDKVTWILETDLEMQKLIYNVMPEPIEHTQAEVALRYPDSDWKCVILLQLEPWDDLADRSLKSGRFHQLAPRKGFGLEDGYTVWKKMIAEWDKKLKREEYTEALARLVEHKCLIERLPNVEKIVVDVDDVLSSNRRGSQSWQFNRLKHILTIIQDAGIEDLSFLSSHEVYARVDDQTSLTQWIDDGLLEIYEDDHGDMHPVISRARKKKAHYLGTRNLYQSGKKKEREYGRTLKYRIESNKISIPGLEPFYDWRQENLFEKMFDIYYE